jgi:hypothetical protein
LPSDQKVYKVLGKYDVVRKYMNGKKYVENDWKPKFEGHKFNNVAWHFLYSTKSKDVFGIPLEDW